MKLPRRVPWSSVAELDQICAWIYSEEADHSSKLRAIHRLSAWRAITFLPHALESTLSLLVVLVQDTPHEQSLHLRQAYAAAIIRLVNGLVDPLQLGAYARSIASIAHQIGLPQWLVELRHAATHEELPSLELLREAANEAMTWLLHNYFFPTLNPAVHFQVKPLRPLAPLLKQYKSLSKVTTRDASLAETYTPALASLTRDVERWISEARVAANLAAADFDWENRKVSDGTNADNYDRERWALDRLCDELLQKGALVPVSKKKRICATDIYSLPTLLIQIWNPLLDSLRTLHPDLPSVLCSNIIAHLSESTDEKEDDPTFAACLARWVLWIVETWDSAAGDEEYGLRKEAVVNLMRAVGHTMTETNKNMPQVRELLLKLCDARQEWQAPIGLLLQSSSLAANVGWAAEHIDVMDQRLSMLQSFADSSQDDGEGAGEVDDLPECSSVVSGWRQLNDTVWRPCPIGMHYPVTARVPAQPI